MLRVNNWAAALTFLTPYVQYNDVPIHHNCGAHVSQPRPCRTKPTWHQPVPQRQNELDQVTITNYLLCVSSCLSRNKLTHASPLSAAVPPEIPAEGTTERRGEASLREAAGQHACDYGVYIYNIHDVSYVQYSL